jgi:predicted ArsR family transcriptional regulator
MKFSVEHDDEQFLLSLERLGKGTVQDLCDAAGVTATAVRQRLVRLQSLGLVDRQAVREGRGRPHHTYQVTELGRRQLGDNYTELARLLWSELHSIDELDIRNRVKGRIRDAMVRQYGANVNATALSDRFSQLGTALASRGFSVEVTSMEADSHELLPILRENHCPYHDLAQQDSGICELEQQVFEQVLGVPLTLVSCCREGHHCCEFHPA